MSYKLDFSVLRQIGTFCVIVVLTFNGASGQSAQESEDSRTKEMRQMWQNIVRQRPHGQVTNPPTAASQKQRTTAKNRPVQPQSTEAQPDGEASRPKYKIISPAIPAYGQDVGITI